MNRDAAVHLAGLRLAIQGIDDPGGRGPSGVVSRLCAMQAQDYPSVLWAIGLRCRGTERAVERAIAARSIVRTWMMRGTLHCVAARDAHWMLDLLAPRLIAGDAHRRRQLGIGEAAVRRCRALFVEALRGGKALSREALYGLMEAAGEPAAGQRGYHILYQLGLEGLLCFGPREGRRHTFVLLEEWIPRRETRLDRGEALARLATRYFRGHGPATLADFAWWSGLPAADARTGLDGASDGLAKETFDGVDHWLPRTRSAAARAAGILHLLPGFDEYLLGYRDRTAVLPARFAQRVAPGNSGMFRPIVVCDGSVIGTWKGSPRKGRGTVEMDFFRETGRIDRAGLEEAIAHHSRFLGMPAADRAG